MRTSVNLDDALLKEAAFLTGLTGPSALLRAGLQALVERERARRFARLGGSEPDLGQAPRRRSVQD